MSKKNLSQKNRKFLNTWVEDHSPLQSLWFPLQTWVGFLLNSPTCFVVHYSRDEGKSTFSKANMSPHKYAWYNSCVLSDFPPWHGHRNVLTEHLLYSRNWRNTSIESLQIAFSACTHICIQFYTNGNKIS